MCIHVYLCVRISECRKGWDGGVNERWTLRGRQKRKSILEVYNNVPRNTGLCHQMTMVHLEIFLLPSQGQGVVMVSGLHSCPLGPGIHRDSFE